MTLADTGPLVALLDAVDPYHAVCVQMMARLPIGPLTTTWPCFTEAMHLLNRAGGFRYQSSLWSLRSTNRIVLIDLTPAEIDRMADLMDCYQNVPMDLADASLVVTLERRPHTCLFTFDHDFRVYCLADGTAIDVVP